MYVAGKSVGARPHAASCQRSLAPSARTFHGRAGAIIIKNVESRHSSTQNVIRRAITASFFVLALLLSYRSLAVGRVEGRIIDYATGQPVAATLALSDAQGKPLEIEGKHSHVEYLGKRRCY